MIVDTHVHVWEIDPPRYPIGPTAPNWTALPDESGTAESLLAEMDEEGVDCSVLVQTSWSTWDNGYIADCANRYPDRFIGHGLLDPLDLDNAAVARYWVKERGLRGFRFHPMYYPERQILLVSENNPLWEEIGTLDVVLQFHLRAQQAEQIDVLARRLPQTPMILDHMGYPQVDQSIQEFEPILDLAQHENIFFKLSDVKGHSQQEYPFEDVHPFIRALLDRFGAERTVWGTGYPAHHRLKHNWLSLADEIRLIREDLPFVSEREIERILGGTAASIWGIGAG